MLGGRHGGRRRFEAEASRSEGRRDCVEHGLVVSGARRGGTTGAVEERRGAGAAIELDAARMELQMAIQQSPDSPVLQRLLNRTEHQQTQLHQLAGQAG